MSATAHEGGRIEIVNNGRIAAGSSGSMSFRLSGGEVSYTGSGAVGNSETGTGEYIEAYVGDGGGKLTFTGDAMVLDIRVRSADRAELNIGDNVKYLQFHLDIDGETRPKLTGVISANQNAVSFYVTDETLTQAMTASEAYEYLADLLPELDLDAPDRQIYMNICGKDGMICHDDSIIL